MTTDLLLALGREALLLMVLTSLPPVGASLLVGFLSSLFQATTSIQDSSLSIVPKLGAAAVALAVAGPWIAAQLARFAAQLFLSVSQVSL